MADTVRAFVAVILQTHLTLEHDLGFSRNLEGLGLAIDEFDFIAAQQARKMIF